MSDSRIINARQDLEAAMKAPVDKAGAFVNDATCYLVELYDETWNDAIGSARSSANAALEHLQDGQQGAANLALTVALKQLSIFEIQIAPVF